MSRRYNDPATRRSPGRAALLALLAGAALLAFAPSVIGSALAPLASALFPALSAPWWVALLPALVLGVLLGGVLLATRWGGQRSEGAESPPLPPPSRVVSNVHFKTITAERPTARFSDVAGVSEAKEELCEVVEFLKYPARFTALGARVPRGTLLVGPPGSGKTLLARAVAGEAGVPFLSASGSEFVELYVGVGAARVRALFQEARRHAPCIVFIDEIDAVGRRRGGNLGLSHEEREQTLNQLLIELDGFDQRTNIIVIAATNRADVLDPALLRPGRFDRQVALDLPDARGRLAILQLHARGKPLGPDADLEALARLTVGLSGADLENLMNEAAISAARNDRPAIGRRELEEALERVLSGPRRKSRVLSAHEREITAHHEIGHALVAHCLPHADPILKVSIVSRGTAGGYTRFAPEEDRNLWSKSQFEAQIAAALGGHIAEELAFGEVTTGPSNDLQRATDLARRMVAEFGMSKRIGPLNFAAPTVYGDGHEYRGFSEELARRLDAEVERVVSAAYARAQAILTTNRDVLVAAARLLLERETLDWAELAPLFAPARDRALAALDGPPAAESPARIPSRRGALAPRVGRPGFLRQRRRAGRAAPSARPALASARRS